MLATCKKLGLLQFKYIPSLTYGKEVQHVFNKCGYCDSNMYVVNNLPHHM